jgi:cytochrome P450
VFKYDFGALADKQDTVHEDYDVLIPQSFTMFHNAFPWYWKTIPTKNNRSLQFRITRFRNSLDQIIAAARERKEKEQRGELIDDKYNYPSLLEAMIGTQDEETSIQMTDAELRDNSLGFFLAGHETTANALSTLFYALGKFPHVQQKCYEEVVRVLGTTDPLREITLEEISHMEYLLMTIKENQRMYRSSMGGTFRATTSDVVLGDFKLPKDTMVSISTSAIHNDPEVWGDPQVFRPERFSEEEVAKRSKFSFLPFGLGPHTCIGELKFMET